MYFNARHLPDPNNEYVAWVDVMGTQASMARSVRTTANFVFKLHIAALEARNHNQDIVLYPVMDGFYASGSNQNSFVSFLRKVYEQAAREFVEEEENIHRFCIRGAVAFGPVYHGQSISEKASPVLAANEDYRSAVLLGLPMVQAHLGEGLAPPFGLFVHESARTFAPEGTEPFHAMWWYWGNAESRTTWIKLKPAMEDYLSWCKARSRSLDYPIHRIEEHERMFSELHTLAGIG